MKSLREYLEESASVYDRPTVGDDFAINIREECLLETYVIGESDDGIVLHADLAMISVLEDYGMVAREPQDEDLLEQGPSGVPRDPRMARSMADLENELDQARQGTTPSLDQDLEKFRSRAQAGEVGTPRKWSQMSDIEKRELQSQGFGPQPTTNEAEMMKEDYKNPVASAVLHRIFMQHPGVLATHGPERVMQVVDELADAVGDVEEIGSSDVSAWTREVIRMLAELPDEPMDEADASTDPFSMDSTEEWANKIRKTAPKTRIDTTNWTDEKRYEHDVKTGKAPPGGFPEWQQNRARRTQPQPVTPPTNEAEYRGRNVPLGKKMAGDVKKSKVYVRKPNGNVVKVEFGDPNMRIKKSNPARRRSFRARHNCDNPGPRWKARYWSCRAW